MAPNTQIGKLFIDREIHNRENPFGDLKYDRGGAFIEDFQSHVWLEFGSRWLHLADYSDLIGDIKEFFTTQRTPSGPLEIRDDGLISPIIHINGLQSPMYKLGDPVKPIIRYKKKDYNKINENYDKRGMR